MATTAPHLQRRSRVRAETPTAPFPRSLLDELGAAFPDLPGAVVAAAVEAATVSASALGAAGEAARRTRIGVLARDRLDAARGRAAAAARGVRSRAHADSAGEPRRASGGDEPVACSYCRAPIPAGAFAYWSTLHRLMSATCPSCGRQMTLLAATWQRAGRTHILALAPHQS